jgi:sugar lactone lactonase YvrE
MKMKTCRLDAPLFFKKMKRSVIFIVLGSTAIAGPLFPALFSSIILPSVRNISQLEIPPFVSTLAGSGHPGLENGAGLSARFNWPTAVVSDRYGNRFIADSGNHVIRQIDRLGMVTTFAGRGSPGFSDGVGRSAAFNGPTAIAIDPSGNLFVADSDNFRIRKITPNGRVTTLAGSGQKGNNEGPAFQAEFIYPTGLAIDRSGALYVADRGAHRIKRIRADGIVMIVAGTGEPGNRGGTAVSAMLHDPMSVAVDEVDNVYIADSGSHTIRRIDSAGVVTTVAGSGLPGYRDGFREKAQFSWPTGVALDHEGNLIVTDSKNHRIRKIKLPEGRVTTLAGNGRGSDLNGTGSAAGFRFPTGIDVDPLGHIYIADSANNQIRLLTSGLLQVDRPGGRTFLTEHF